MVKQYSELTTNQRDQVAARFPLTSKTQSNYVYEITADGSVLCRKTLAQHERDIAVLIKPAGSSLKIDGWDL